MLIFSPYKRAYRILRNEGIRELGHSILAYITNAVLLPSTKIRFRAFRYRLRGHPGVGDPLRVYEVPMSDLNYCITSSEFPERINGFKISDASWDSDAIPIESFPLFVMSKKHFEQDIPWEKTERFKRRREKLETEGSFGELDLSPEQQSIDAYREYLDYLDFLYESIKNNGYKRQSELSPESDFLNRDHQHPALGEIGVFIGRDGKIIARSGLHRACFAKLIGVESVPVRTVVRHESWQEIRDEIATTPRTELSERAKRHLSHPELQDLL